MDDTLINQLNVIDKSWEINVNLPEENHMYFIPVWIITGLAEHLKVQP